MSLLCEHPSTFNLSKGASVYLSLFSVLWNVSGRFSRPHLHDGRLSRLIWSVRFESETHGYWLTAGQQMDRQTTAVIHTVIKRKDENEDLAEEVRGSNPPVLESLRGWYLNGNVRLNRRRLNAGSEVSDVWFAASHFYISCWKKENQRLALIGGLEVKFIILTNVCLVCMSGHQIQVWVVPRGTFYAWIIKLYR